MSQFSQYGCIAFSHITNQINSLNFDVICVTWNDYYCSIEFSATWSWISSLFSWNCIISQYSRLNLRHRKFITRFCRSTWIENEVIFIQIENILHTKKNKSFETSERARLVREITQYQMSEVLITWHRTLIVKMYAKFYNRIRTRTELMMSVFVMRLDISFIDHVCFESCNR